MNFETELLAKSRERLKKNPYGIMTTKQFRRELACIRLNNRIMKSILQKLINSGDIEYKQNGMIVIKKR